MIQYPDLEVELIDAREYDFAINILRKVFRRLGFIEVPVQHRISILAACENPASIATYAYGGRVWPLPQTGQMWLEWELLRNPKAKGFYCISTSYRNEYDVIPGRHNRIFPMFEFETHGTIDDLEKLERKILSRIGFRNHPESLGDMSSYPAVNYDSAARRFSTVEIDADHEMMIDANFGHVVLLKNFPEHTSPFWNMKRNKLGTHANKIDVIINGIETIGSAERSCDPIQMRHSFETISDGNYAKMLYYQFTKERVLAELDAFLALNFFPRVGGGIGINRFIRALKLQGIMPEFK